MWAGRRRGFAHRRDSASIPRMPLAEPAYLRYRQPWRDLRRPRRFHRGTVYSIKDISAELMSDPERQLLLFCGPDQGGWRLGSFPRRLLARLYGLGRGARPHPLRAATRRACLSKRERPSVAEALTWLRAEIVRRDRAHSDKAAARADHDLACLKAVARVVEIAGKDARTLAANCVSQIRHYELGEDGRPLPFGRGA